MSLPNIPLIISRAASAAAADHGGLGGLTDDDHPQYLLLAGRTGATNDAIISTDADGTIYGSELAANDLILRPNNEAQAIANAGRIRLNERVVLWEDIPDISGLTSTFALSHAATLTMTGAAGAGSILSPLLIAPIIAFAGGGGTVSTYRCLTNAAAFTASSVSATQSLFVGVENITTCALASTTHTVSGIGFDDFPTYSCTTAISTPTHGHTGVETGPLLRASGAGAALSFGVAGFVSSGEMNTDDVAASIAVASWTGFRMQNPSIVGPGTSAATVLIGVDIENLTSGTTNLSLNSTGSSVQMRHAGPAIFGANEAPVSTLSVGTGSLFRVAGADGDLERIKNVAYDWPAANAAGVLTNNGSGTLSWTAAVTDHGALTGLTDDDHAQYLLLAGRTGTANDALLSTSTNGTFTGSSAASGDLIVQGTTADQNGLIRMQDELTLREDWPASAVGVTKYACSFTPAMTLSSTGGGARTFFVAPTGTISVSASYQLINWAPVMTLSHSSANASAVHTEGEFTYETAGANFRMFRAQTTLSANDSVFAPANAQVFLDNMTYLSEGVATGTTATIRSFHSNFTVNAADTAVWPVTTIDCVHLNPIIDEDAGATLTVTTFRGLFFGPTITGSPAITTMTGIQINNFTAGTTNISFYSSGATPHMRHVGQVHVGADATPTAKFQVTEATVGNEAVRITSTATNDDPNYMVRQYRAETTDATVTTLGSITLTASRTALVEARVIGRRTAGAAGTAEDGIGVVVRGGYKMVGGAATALTNGTPTTDFETDDQAAWTATLDTSGADVRIRVTGAVNNTVTWHATAFIQTVGT